MSYSEPAHSINQKRWQIAIEIEMLVLDAILAALECVTLDGQNIEDKPKKTSDHMEPF